MTTGSVKGAYEQVFMDEYLVCCFFRPQGLFIFIYHTTGMNFNSEDLNAYELFHLQVARSQQQLLANMMQQQAAAHLQQQQQHQTNKGVLHPLQQQVRT